MTDDVKVTLPMLHPNGSGFNNLFHAARAAHDAINDARAAMRQACPHGRDYYTLGPGVYETARNEWLDEMERLNQVAIYLEKWLLGLYEMNEGRR